MLGDRFGYTVEDAFEVVHLASVLDFDDDNLAFTVQSLDVHTVEFVVKSRLVAFTFEDFQNLDFFADHDGQETFEHTEVGLLAQ